MRRSSKYPNEEPLEYRDWRGGVNLIDPPRLIAENELVNGMNVEIDAETGRLQSRPRLGAPVATLPDPVRKVWIHPKGHVLAAAGKKLYYVFPAYSGSSYRELGGLSGVRLPNFWDWDEKIFAVSGGKLQYLDGTLKTILKSPDCDMVHSRFGRIVVSKAGQDDIPYSSIGDATSDEAWVENSNNALQAQKLEVAYKESGDILTVVPLLTDLVVFRTFGIYRVTSEFPDWLVHKITTDTTAVNSECAVELANTAAFLSEKGLKILAGVQEYPNIKQQDIAVKVNEWLSKRIDPGTAWVKHLKNRKQLIIKPRESNWVLVYHYQYDAATTWKFSSPISDIVEWKNGVLAAQGNNLFYLDRYHTTDNGSTVTATVLMKQYKGFNDFLVKRLALGLENKRPGTLTFSVSGVEFEFALGNNWDLIHGDTSLIYGDSALVWQDTLEDVDQRNVVRKNFLQLGITCSTDFVLDSIRLEKVVVGNG
jgi:hypothetical protein